MFAVVLNVEVLNVMFLSIVPEIVTANCFKGEIVLQAVMVTFVKLGHC